MARNISLSTILAVGVLAVSGAPAMAGATSSGYDETGVLGNVPPSGPTVLGASAVRPATSAAPAAATAPVAATAQVTPTQSVESGGSSLPFTGFDAGIVLLLGAVLFGTGFAVRRVTRAPADA